MIKKHLAFFLALLTFFFLSNPAMAYDSGFYGGIFIGQVDMEEQGIETSEVGFGIIGGYSFNSYIDIEAALLNTGEHRELGLEAVGASLSVVGNYSINNQWQLFGQFGGRLLDLDIDESVVTLDDEGNPSLSDGRDSSLFFGYGVKYNLEKWSVFLRRSHADADADLIIISLGALYRF